MDMSKMGELLKFQQEAMKIKKELENTLIESEVDGLVIVINGEMKVEDVFFESDTLIAWLSPKQQEALKTAIKEAVNKGMKKSQEIAAERMQTIMDQMGMKLPIQNIKGM